MDHQVVFVILVVIPMAMIALPIFLATRKERKARVAGPPDPRPTATGPEASPPR